MLKVNMIGTIIIWYHSHHAVHYICSIYSSPQLELCALWPISLHSLQLPSSWQSPFCLLLLWIQLFKKIPHRSEIMQYLSFCAWLISLNIMCSRFSSQNNTISYNKLKVRWRVTLSKFGIYNTERADGLVGSNCAQTQNLTMNWLLWARGFHWPVRPARGHGMGSTNMSWALLGARLGDRQSPKHGKDTPPASKSCILEKKTARFRVIKNGISGVSIVAQWVKNLTSIHEDAGLTPGLTQWIKDPVLLWAVV